MITEPTPHSKAEHGEDRQQVSHLRADPPQGWRRRIPRKTPAGAVIDVGRERKYVRVGFDRILIDGADRLTRTQEIAAHVVIDVASVRAWAAGYPREWINNSVGCYTWISCLALDVPDVVDAMIAIESCDWALALRYADANPLTEIAEATFLGADKMRNARRRKQAAEANQNREARRRAWIDWACTIEALVAGCDDPLAAHLIRWHGPSGATLERLARGGTDGRSLEEEHRELHDGGECGHRVDDISELKELAR